MWAGPGLPVCMAAWAWKPGKSIISRQGAAAAFVFHSADAVFFVFLQIQMYIHESYCWICRVCQCIPGIPCSSTPGELPHRSARPAAGAATQLGTLLWSPPRTLPRTWTAPPPSVSATAMRLERTRGRRAHQRCSAVRRCPPPCLHCVASSLLKGCRKTGVQCIGT